MQALNCTVDYSQAGPALDVRRHGFSQGGIDDEPLPPRAVELLKALQPRTVRFFVQEYFAMMPGVGEYQWDTIDAQLLSLAATGATPILALTMKPKCLYPLIDHRITRPGDWSAWERFIFDMTRHFAQDLKLPGLWYEVGNEPDIGEMGGCPYLFTPDDYAEHYDRTVRAVLRADPSAKVGGPALALFMGDKAFAAGFARALQATHHSPLHFFSWHTYNPANDGIERQHAANKQFLRELGEPFASALTVIDEWNLSWVCSSQFGEFLQASFAVDAVARLLDCPIDLTHYYHAWDMLLDERKWQSWYSAEGLEKMKQHWCGDYRGLHMFSHRGEPAASYIAFKMLYEMEGRRLPMARPAPHLGVLASASERGCRALLWNYHHEMVRTERVKVDFINLPHAPSRQRHARLGGGTFRDLECLLAARQGQIRWLADGPPGEIVVEPYSVHLLSAEW